LFASLFLLAVFAAPARAEVEIDMGDEEATTTEEATATPEPSTPIPTPTVQAESEVYVSEETEPTATPVPKAVVEEVTMRALYEAGLKAYQNEDYPRAIRFLKRALTIKDADTKDYYYAEANAMLGVIYQFYSTAAGHRATAYGFYKEALRIDPETETARKYINQVKPR